MTVLKGKVTSAKEHAGLVWLHISSWSGKGWVALSKNLFDNVYKKRLINQIYGRHNRSIKTKINGLEREIKRLKKGEGKEYTIREKEYQIHVLRGQLKEEIHMHDLERKKIFLRI